LSDPVILIVYDGENDKAYWVHIQAYMSGRRTPELFGTRGTVNVRVSMVSKFNRRAIRAIAKRKNHIHQQIRRMGPKNV
jgi:hypothetical protein